MRVYAMLVTAGLAMNISGTLIWELCPKLDVIEVMVYAIFISLAAAGVFILLTEPRKKKHAKWVQVGGISVMMQRSSKR